MSTTVPKTAHTVDEALERFDLIAGQGDGETTACAMTAISWIAGNGWSDHPECAHRLLADLVIRANDAKTTTPAERADIVRAGEHGLIDTWWLPDTVVLGCLAESRDEDPVVEVLATLALAAWWKVDKRRANLSRADLSRANLSRADLSRANLSRADLSRADLSGANLSGADLSRADLSGANLSGANLSRADLSRANLSGANLSRADHSDFTRWPEGFDKGRLA
jgi:hypothetical protein